MNPTFPPVPDRLRRNVHPRARIQQPSQIAGDRVRIGRAAVLTGPVGVSERAMIGLDGGAVSLRASEGYPLLSICGDAYITGVDLKAAGLTIENHTYIDGRESYVTMGPIGSEGRTAIAAWDYAKQDIYVRAGCYYGSLDHLERRIAAANTWRYGFEEVRERYRTQYQALIAAASYIPRPEGMPTSVTAMRAMATRQWGAM